MFNLISVIHGWCIACQIALRWMPLDLTNEKSTLVQVMAWCHQATSHYQCQFDPDICRHMASLGHNELNSQMLLLYLTHEDELWDGNCEHTAFAEKTINQDGTWLWRVFSVVKHEDVTGGCFGGDDTWVLGHEAGAIHFTLVVDFDLNFDFAAHWTKTTELCNNKSHCVRRNTRRWDWDGPELCCCISLVHSSKGRSGPRLNIKTVFPRYGDSHVKR